VATHADEALGLLGDATPAEREILREFQYQPNTATLHTDARVMPKTRLAWSSWNYELTSRTGSGHHRDALLDEPPAGRQ
jgi:predicted NAD/FAD-binding protein